MRIGIDTRSLLLPISGIGRYTQQIIKYLKKIKNSKDELIFFWGAGFDETNYLIDDIGKSEHIHGLNKQGVQSLWEQTILPYRIKKHNLDIYHSPRNYNIPYLNINKTPLIVTMHDIIPILFPEEYRFSKLAKWRFKLTAKRADHIITISKHSKKDITKQFAISKDNISVISNAVDEKFYSDNIDDSRLEWVKKNYDIKNKYILTTGGTEPIKNSKILFEVMKLGIKNHPNIFKDIELIIIGSKWPGKEIPDNKPANVKFTGYIEEEDLPVLMQGAEIFVFPSLYEGFGLPPLEAMAAGTMVIASNSSSIPEVVGDAGVLIEPKDVDAWVKEIKRALKSETGRDNYVNKGLKQIKKFSWNKTVEELYEIYEKAIWENKK